MFEIQCFHSPSKNLYLNYRRNSPVPSTVSSERMHSCCVEVPPPGGAKLPSTVAKLQLALWLKKQVEATGVFIDGSFL